jgi:hypothetical protein
MISDVFADNHLATDKELAALLQDSTDELPPGSPLLHGASCVVAAKKLLAHLRALCSTGYARSSLLERAHSVFILPEDILLEGFLAGAYIRVHHFILCHQCVYPHGSWCSVPG